MKMKNLVAFAMLALGAVAAPFAGRAEVSGGDIYSVDLSTKFGGVIPAPGTTLTIGESVTVRIRLVNKMNSESNPLDWRFVPDWPSGEVSPEESAFGPQLGLMLGGQQVFADYLGSEQTAVSGKNMFTDLYFQYTVKSGDLALPARFMTIGGKAVGGDDDATDYAIHYCNYLGAYWKLTNNNGAACVFHFCSDPLVPNPDPTWEAGEPHRYITGTGLGINVKTVDFDTTYFKDPSAPGVDDGVWRQLYVGLSTALPSLPAVKVDGFADVSATMYVWVENEDNDDPVAQVLASDNPEKIDGRWVIKVPIAKGAQSATFKLQGVREGTVKVRMSASRELSYDKSGDVIADWVERNVSVVPAPNPFVMVETLNPAGDAQTEFDCTANYKDYVGMFRVTLSLPPTNKVTVTLTPDWADVIPADVDKRRIGLSKSGEKADLPWLDRDLSLEFEAGESVKALYIYALDRTTDHKGKVTFTPSLTGPGAAMYTGTPSSGAIVVNGATPEITAPASGEELDTAVLKEPYTLFFEVTDGYRCLNDLTGWKIEYKCSAVGDTKSHTVSGAIEEGTQTLSADIKFTQKCVHEKFQARVKDPNGVYSGWRTYYVTVEEGRSVKVTYDRTGSYAESAETTAEISFELSQTSGDDLYLFLEPLNEAASNHVSTAQIAEEGNRNGIEVPAGETEGRGKASILLLDGGYGSDYNPKFRVVVCNEESYDPDAEQEGWAGSCTITITNVAPAIVSASMGGQTIKVNGGVTKAVAQNVEKTFRLAVNEPGRLDLEATGDDAFLTQWKFGTGDWEDMPGNPNLSATVIKHTFNSPGDQTVTVRCQDKDMRKLSKWSEEFSFTVPVLDQPRVVITPVQGRRQYYEDETGADYAFNVTLTAAPDIGSSDRLNVEIRRELLGDASKYSVDDLILSKDAVTFSGGTASGPSFFLKQLDGTAESAASGFRIVAHVTNADTEGKTWDDAELEVYILNRDPSILNPSEQSLDKEGKVIPTTTTIGAENTLAWSLKDVVADKKGMTVTWETSEGQRKTYKQGVDADDVMSGTHTFDFSSAGDKSITMSVLDKDGGTASRTFYYTIEASKTLELVPHGPPSGNGTPLSSRYHDKASGLGAGKVWADNVNFYRNWVFSGNCGIETSWRIYAAGYAYGEHDVRPELGFDYTYMPEDGKDSFLYAWLQIAQEKDAAKPTDTYLAVVPEHRGAANSGTLISLPTEKINTSGDNKSGGTYAKTSAEAIFAKEYLVSDNMGDINQDGVPDIYVKKYDFGIYSDDGNVAGDDLKAITAANENGNLDEDYLPMTGSSAYSTLIPGLPSSWADGTPFTAKTEIRGYGEALNDAPAQVGISDVAPERRYTDPRADSRSTLDGLDPNGSQEPVEYYAWLAFATRSGLDPEEEANWKLWSPERPTDPCSPDTDDDGFSDGYEYFFWYRAHVGYMENGVHRYLTGRAYDPKNPGEGKFISAEEIEALIDPLAASGDPSSAKLRDTDNDGLPDLLEFEIGTNPFDFDTDGDGLPDGFELMLGGTDPLLSETTPGVSDAMRNYDGDAMAFTTPKFEKDLVQPTPKVIDDLFTFALVDPQGDTDGIQWYVGKAAPTNIVPLAACVTGTYFRIDSKAYVASGKVPVVDGRLATDLPKETTWEVAKLESLTNALPSLADIAGTTAYVALMPARIAAGSEVGGIDEEATYATLAFGEKVGGVNAAWVYGRSVSRVTKGDSLANIGGFGMLAIGRYQDAEAKRQIAALPAKDDNVAYLHHFVYQEFGFDPRTAWNANTPLAPRWGKTVGEGESAEVVANNFAANYSYAGISTRTREYTLYDEFLVLSFFLNNGKLDLADVTATQARPWEKIWSLYTTNGQGPNEPNWEPDNEDYKGRTAETNSGENGCDTDQDGVPDGWELYVMAGPKQGGKYNLVAPYDDGYYSSFGPFVADAAKASVTDNEAKGDYGYMAGDGDGLTELQEFAGTDSCGYYNGYDGAEGFTVYSVGDKAIRRPEEHKQWLNKFFPTDPWNADTDGDSLKDNENKNQNGFKCGNFLYGTPVDDGKSCCIPGGGLNPCTVDTDMDGLPDTWEAQFAGEKIYTGDDAQIMKGRDGTEGNPKQGLCDGMDGTVFDAFNTPHKNYTTGAETETEVVILNGTAQVVDRDYDKDGLDNWQEYLTGAMRCWRYDDPLTRWDAIPDAAYYDDYGQFDISRAILWAKEAAPDEDISDANAFWYATLIDSSSAIYNPHLLTGMTPCAQYFTRIENGWDPVYGAGETYYLFHDRFAWGYMAKPRKYACCSPLKADTDQDGMDDYWELFHGLNPLLGESGVTEDSDGPCDIVFDAWYDGVSSPVSALHNSWLRSVPGNGDYDFTVHPWLNGLATADPDGDDIRNQDESIMPLVAPSATWYHTDPTPLWMTDSSYSNSLVRLFFRMPVRFNAIPGVPESVTDPKGREIPLVEFQGYSKGKILAFTPDYWTVSLPGYDNWAYSFEENEGYDTDHDSTSDFEELQGKVRSKTDPQDADSPRRRQAMHFGGPANPSALQSMPFVDEAYPRATLGYPDDMSFLQYTVECWVKPESTADATVIERTSFVDPSHCADERYVRRNFRLAIRDGKWHASFDANGTLDGSTVEVLGKTDAAANAWTYVAATYDANRLTLYVNGREDGYVMSSLKPEYGSSAVVVYPGDGTTMSTNGVMTGDIEASKGEPHAYWFDREYSLHAFLLGASFSDSTDDRYSLNVMNGRGWRGYHDFFTGCIDEVRVWDGARSSSDIAADYDGRKRYTREDAIANRSAFYKQWVAGERRYGKDPTTGKDAAVIPELRFHWAFDSIPGAENAAAVAQAPHGFLDVLKPVWSAPEGYAIPWWSTVVAGYGSVYAGNLNWVPWIPNTVTHLPRFDATTLDSAYWSADYAGDEPGSYPFARTAEPVSKWTQMIRNATAKVTEFRSTSRRFWLAYNTGTNATSSLAALFEFTGRHLNQVGDDLLPLGGAFVKYVDAMWDDQGASSMWEQTGEDADADGLPDWWQVYAEQNYREGVPEGEDITWNTMIWYEVGGVEIRMTAGEAYLRDLAKGAYVGANGEFHVGPTAYAQTARSDGMIPDWWKELKKIDGEEPLSDLDNDGLNNYVEYVASELLPFQLNLDPRMASTDTRTLDYFRKIGRLYLGEMLTDHDQMEDHWERSLGDESIASAALWDALKDGEEDGWTNFAENRYNGYRMGILAQLISHAMGDNEVLDAPIPSIRMKVRYNGDRPLSGAKEGEKGDSAPALVVRAFSKSAETGSYVMTPDAAWTLTPGVPVEKEVYLGGWEDRVVRGTMAPGNIDLGSVNIMFAQVPQNDLYSWTDESGTHLAATYKEFKEAFEKNPNIIQNIQNFEWLELYAPANEYTSSDRAVTVTRNEKGQDNARFAVYGEPVGTINLSTGEFEFDMAAMNKLRYNYTYDGGKGPAAAWSYREAIFKITYTATVPTMQQKIMDFSLAKADKGFVRGGLNSFQAFYDLNADGVWTPGEPFGVVNDVEIGWSGRDVEIELTDMSAVTPRIGIWADTSDRIARWGETPGVSNRVVKTVPTADLVHVRVARYEIDGQPVSQIGVIDRVVLDRTFDRTATDFIHEGDFLENGELDLDWSHLVPDVAHLHLASYQLTNVNYLVVVGDGATGYDFDGNGDDPDVKTITALSTMVTRRFEASRSAPVPCRDRCVFNKARPTFAWTLANENSWASEFGTTYTAFKIVVKSGSNKVYESPVTRLPAKDSKGVYTWTPPLYVGEVSPSNPSAVFANLADYTWQVYVYNAKFNWDADPSDPVTFRMNVTTQDTSSESLAVRVCYAGPAAKLANRVRVQAFESPDFTGDPVAEVTLGDVSLSPSNTSANATLVGLPSGSYFIRAYIDTNGNGVRDDWESWGYLSERDRAGSASKPDIFNVVAIASAFNPSTADVRKVLIEDCDTDGDWFPDVWEAEQNKENPGEFDPEKIKPVTGDAELIGVNTNLDANLTKTMQGVRVLASADGFALLTGIEPAKVKTTVAASGATRFSVDNKVDSVTISKLEFDANGNVVISLDAKTSAGAVDPAAAAIYDLDLSKTVTCRIYRKTDLASAGWGEPVAEEEVTVGAGPVTIEIAGEKTAQAYYRAEIVEK